MSTGIRLQGKAFSYQTPRCAAVQSVSCWPLSQTPAPDPNISDPRESLQTQKGVSAALEAETHLPLRELGPRPSGGACNQAQLLVASAKGLPNQPAPSSFLYGSKDAPSSFCAFRAVCGSVQVLKPVRLP